MGVMGEMGGDNTKLRSRLPVILVRFAGSYFFIDCRLYVPSSCAVCRSSR